MRWVTLRVLATVFLFITPAGIAWAHITPPVVLVSDRDAVVGLLQGAKRFFVREVQPTPADRQAIEKETGWRPEEAFYRFYLGRDEQGELVAATIFVTEFTIHGPVRVAVALGPRGDVRGATVVELTEETYPWVKPLLDRNFARQFIGQGSRGAFQVNATGESMTQFYGQVVASLIQRAAVLFDATVLRGGP